MKPILIRAITAIAAFTLGLASAVIWNFNEPTPVISKPYGDCAILYDAHRVARRIRENDHPELFRAFQEMPLYAMPECVDEAYSLTWIPSFNGPVFVRVWRVGDQAFMVAKSLDPNDDTKVRESHERPLTRFEWRHFTEQLDRAAYWELPETADERIPEDGVVWLVDGLKLKHHHWVRRRLPREGYAEICKHLINYRVLKPAMIYTFRDR